MAFRQALSPARHPLERSLEAVEWVLFVGAAEAAEGIGVAEGAVGGGLFSQS